MCWYPECVWAGVCGGEHTPHAATLVGGQLLWTPEGCPNPWVYIGESDPTDQRIQEYCDIHDIQRRHIRGQGIVTCVPVWLKKEQWHITDEELYQAYRNDTLPELLGLERPRLIDVREMLDAWPFRLWRWICKKFGGGR